MACVVVAFYEIINMYVLNGLKSEWHIKFWSGRLKAFLVLLTLCEDLKCN